MKFMTWNVNGIRALLQYHPYCDELHKNYKEILDYLGADVICLQETKITRSKLDTDLALVPGYDSYWSFHRTKSGYSGVVVYVKDSIKLLAAEEGISGILSGNLPFLPLLSTTSTVAGGSGSGKVPSNSSTGTKQNVGGYPQFQGECDPVDGVPHQAKLTELDTEGRAIVLDFGFFVLFNLYCPNETDETRLPLKMSYYRTLEARVRALIEQDGRQVIVVGDMNVIPTELDHCDPERWKKDAGLDNFTDTPPRQWFNNFLAPKGPLTDLYRVFHKGEAGAFTCWNTKINARPSNYGTRLDYILVTEGLLPWFKSCDRLPQIVGSDHCPVIAEMFAELTISAKSQEISEAIQGADKELLEETQKALEEQTLGDELPKGVESLSNPSSLNPTECNDASKEGSRQAPTIQRLQDIMDSYGGTNEHTLAAKYFDEFSGKQQKLFSFFKRPSTIQASAPSPETPSPGSTKGNLDVPSPALQRSGSTSDAEPKSLGANPNLSESTLSTLFPLAVNEAQEIGAEPLLDLDRPSQGLAKRPASEDEHGAAKKHRTDNTAARVSQPGPTIGPFAKMTSSLPSPTKQQKQQQPSSLGSTKKSITGNGKSSAGGSSGQQQTSMLAFLSGSSRTKKDTSPQVTKDTPKTIKVTSTKSAIVGHSEMPPILSSTSSSLTLSALSAMSSQEQSFDFSLSEESMVEGSINSEDKDGSVGCNQSQVEAGSSECSNNGSATPFSPKDFADWIPGSQDVLPFASNGVATTSKWQSLFTPRVVPKCRVHGAPCTEYTVNKKGPNKGRRFYLCSLPIGPNGDKKGQHPDYRCNYFEWLNPERKR